jgi:hypothetical protein
MAFAMVWEFALMGGKKLVMGETRNFSGRRERLDLLS